MKVVQLTCLQEYLDRPMCDNHTTIFRGVSDSSYELITSIGRIPIKTEQYRFAYEKNLIEEFQRRAHPHLTEKPIQTIDWLCLAQHYGLPTRLLDWTSNPLVAMYFATEKYPDKDFAVYIRTQQTWLAKYESMELEEISHVYGIRPPHTDSRFINQDGIFTLHPEPATPIDDDHTVKFVFSSEMKDEIKWKIHRYGICPSRIYPGLDGISKDILREIDRSSRYYNYM